MENFFDKIRNGIKKAIKFNDENNEAKARTPLILMIFNDILPLLVVISYLIMGLVKELWHPGWIIFLVIPIYYSLMECIKHKSPSMFPMPILIAGIYLLLGCIKGLWHPYWAIFAVVPFYYAVIALIKTKNIWKILDCIFPLIIVGIYLILGFVLELWHPGWIIFFAIPLYYQIKATIGKYKLRKKTTNIKESPENFINEHVDGDIN